MSILRVREIPWGTCEGNADQTCIYVLGIVDPSVFLSIVKAKADSDVPEDVRASLTVDDVDHSRFRPMSPSEARAWGADHGVMESPEGRGYPITRVVV